MADTWLTIEQAAVKLGLSVRTVNRHINSGKLQSRLFEGRREVFVTLPDDPSDSEPNVQGNVPRGTNVTGPSGNGSSDGDGGGATSSATSRPAEVSEGRPRPTATHVTGEASAAGRSASASASGSTGANGIDSDTMLALSDNWADGTNLMVNAYQTLAKSAEAQAEANHRSAIVAWSAVAVMVVAIVIAVGWTTFHLTKASVENRVLNEQAAQLKAEADKQRAEAEALRQKWMTQTERAANAEGKLVGYTEAAAKPSATQPAGGTVPPGVPVPSTVPATAPTPTVVPAPTPTGAGGTLSAGVGQPVPPAPAAPSVTQPVTGQRIAPPPAGARPTD